jgi:HlyD family secretion protein
VQENASLPISPKPNSQLLVKMLMKRIKRQVRIGLLALGVVALISGGIYAARRALLAGNADVLPLTAVVKPHDFTLKIAANGELQSAESMAIAVPFVPVFRLRIASVVPDGRRVQKGDVLVEFDPSDLDLEALEHRSSLELANQKITKGEMAVGMERTDIAKDKKIAELELEKINEFFPRDESIYSRRQMIEGQLDKDYTESKLVYADVRLQLKGRVYSLDEAILFLERQQVNAKIGQVDRALASLKLLSPASGIIVYNDFGFYFGGFTIQPGRTVNIGQGLFNLVNPEKMEAKCYVLEKDAGELRKDQNVSFTLDPFPGRSFTGRVKNIDSLARPIERDSPVKYFQTTIALDNTDVSVMKPGVKLKAEITAGDLKSVVVVPRSAVVKKDGDFIAYVESRPGQFAPVKVKLGQGDLIQVVVTEGLNAGQTLALNPPDVKRTSSRESKTEK